MRLPNTVTIDSIYEKHFLSPSSVLEAVIVDTFLLAGSYSHQFFAGTFSNLLLVLKSKFSSVGTNIYILNLGDLWSSCTIDLYLHRRYNWLLITSCISFFPPFCFISAGARVFMRKIHGQC